MATFILVHGAWHGAWCWEKIVPLLEAAGHSVDAPNLPGMGKDDTAWKEDVLDQWADFVCERVEAATAPVVLVGHSRGGVVISQAAERCADKIDRLVYLAAFLLSDGQSLRDAAIANPGTGVRDAAIFAEDRRTSRIDPARAAGMFAQLASEEDKLSIAPRLSTEPVQPHITPVSVSAEKFGRIPRAYIETAQDKVIPLAAQRAMQASWTCDPVITLDADHSPFLSAPDQLADALVSLAEK